MPIGETLSGGRRARGLSVHDVAAATRIRPTVIEAIERDDFAPCGGDVYARGHIRSIAKVVGVDATPLLVDFSAQHVDDAPSVRTIVAADRAARPERRSPNWSAAMAVVLVGLVAFGIWQASRNGDGAESSSEGTVVAGAEASPSGDPGTATAPVAPAPSEPAPPAPTVVAEIPPGVTVRLAVDGGVTWVSAVAGETEVFEGLVDTGEVKEFADPGRVKLVLGNAGVARLVVNGVDVGIPGGLGEVVTQTFVPGDPTAVISG